MNFLIFYDKLLSYHCGAYSVVTSKVIFSEQFPKLEIECYSDTFSMACQYGVKWFDSRICTDQYNK